MFGMGVTSARFGRVTRVAGEGAVICETHRPSPMNEMDVDVIIQSLVIEDYNWTVTIPLS